MTVMPADSGREFHWDVICITARLPAHAEAYKRELQRRRAGSLGSSSSSSSATAPARRQDTGGRVCELPLATLVLAVGDPANADGTAPTKRIGSGGATLNALLLVAEHLSALSGENNVDMTALQGRRVLVLHVGGGDQRMPAFSLLPVRPANGSSTSRPLSTVDLLLEGLASLARCCPPGLFVVSSEDSFVRVGSAFHDRFVQAACRKLDGIGTATAIASAVPLEAARAHGVYELEEAGNVQRVLYRAPTEELVRARLKALEPTDARVAKVCGVVFFDEMATDRLLQLAFHPLFEACSFLGIDNGAQPSGFSLYLDLLACMGSDVSSEDFQRPSSIDGQVRVDEDMRAQLWKQFHGQVHLQAVVADINDPSQYMSVRSTQDYVSLIAKVMSDSASAEGAEADQSVRTQTFIDAGTPLVSPSSAKPILAEPSADTIDESACMVNSVLRACRVGHGAIIESSAMEGCTVGAESVCSGLKRVHGLAVPSGILLQQVSLLSGGTPSGSFCFATCSLQDEASRHEVGGLFLGQQWPAFLHDSGITAVDLWGEDAREGMRTLANARLFPIVSEAIPGSLGLLWLEYAAALESAKDNASMRHTLLDLWKRRRVQVWRAAPRISFAEIMATADIGAEFEWQDVVAAETNVLRARHLLLFHRRAPLRQILDDETRRGRWGLLDVFDSIVAAPDTPLDVAARTLGQIAEVLASFGGVEGGLRSGSARNPLWRGPIALLRSADPAARREAVHQMKSVRTQWLHEGPVALIRAARHYEAAAQVLICTAVGSAAEFINISPRPALTAGSLPREVVVEAPARIDIAGGWTDTPPICYEHGGAVTTLAVQVDGCRPIGAKARHLADCFEIRLETRAEGKSPAADGDQGGGGGTSSMVTVCRCLADFDDHDSPNAPAALLKTCVLCAGVVVLGADALPLEDQLRPLGGGLHLVSWSRLPQGSGMGTSSILAAVVMKALLVALGREIDDKSLIHAVLKVEQMLTTGGGWQDQVGGIIGGAKIARSAAALPLHVEPEELPMTPEFAKEIASRLVLVFTGRPRLAKYLLQNVIRQWFGRMPEICSTLRGLVTNAEAAAEAIKEADLSKLGACIDTYWAQKRLMAPGCEPATITALRERLAPGLLGMTLAGAGGGGFAVLLTREPQALEWVRTTLKGCPGADEISFHAASIDFTGLTVL